MHFAFIPYGARTELERLYRDMEAQKFLLKLTKEGEEDKGVYINGQIRILPLGVVEYVFPREHRDLVLHTMLSANSALTRYGVSKLCQTMIQKVIKLKKIPKYEKKAKLLWCIEHVSIYPVGIREDIDHVELKDMGFKGWTHESI